MPKDERDEIEAAMNRLLDGTPLRSGGKLTVVSLAAEASVKRAPAHPQAHRPSRPLLRPVIGPRGRPA
jgi:hypothetical protein